MKSKKDAELLKALATIVQYMIVNDAGSFEAECTTNNGIIATLKIEIIDLRDSDKPVEETK